MAHVPGVVAIFVNRNYREEGELFFYIREEADIFLLSYAEMILENHALKLNICYESIVANSTVSQEMSRMNRSFPQHIRLHRLKKSFENSPLPEADLLILTYETCREIAVNQSFFCSLPSLLVIRNKNV